MLVIQEMLTETKCNRKPYIQYFYLFLTDEANFKERYREI